MKALTLNFLLISPCLRFVLRWKVTNSTARLVTLSVSLRYQSLLVVTMEDMGSRIGSHIYSWHSKISPTFFSHALSSRIKFRVSATPVTVFLFGVRRVKHIWRKFTNYKSRLSELYLIVIIGVILLLSSKNITF